jgi:hypothetical protein
VSVPVAQALVETLDVLREETLAERVCAPLKEPLRLGGSVAVTLLDAEVQTVLLAVWHGAEESVGEVLVLEEPETLSVVLGDRVVEDEAQDVAVKLEERVWEALAEVQWLALSLAVVLTLAVAQALTEGKALVVPPVLLLPEALGALLALWQVLAVRVAGGLRVAHSVGVALAHCEELGVLLTEEQVLGLLLCEGLCVTAATLCEAALLTLALLQCDTEAAALPLTHTLGLTLTDTVYVPLGLGKAQRDAVMLGMLLGLCVVQCVAVTEKDLEALEQGLAEGVDVDAVVREAVLLPEPPLVLGVAATENELRSEAVAELLELGGSVAEARAVELRVPAPRDGVSTPVNEPVMVGEAQGVEVGSGEPEAQVETLGEGEGLGEVLAVALLHWVPLAVALGDCVAAAVPDAGGEDEAQELEVAWGVELGVAVLQALGVTLRLGEREEVAVEEVLSEGVALPVAQAESVRCREAEVLTEAEPCGVGETLGEAEFEPATLALPDRVTVAQAEVLGTTVALRLLRSEAVGGTEAEALIEEIREGVEE